MGLMTMQPFNAIWIESGGHEKLMQGCLLRVKSSGENMVAQALLKWQMLH